MVIVNMSTIETMSKLYIPQGCKRLDELTEIPQIRCGIQGAPGTGKTFAALTFPNVIIANLDRGIGAHYGRNDVVQIPFHSMEFCRSVMPNVKYENKKDVLIKWLETEGMKLTPVQTLVWDGLSITDSIFNAWFSANEHQFLTKDSQKDGFAQWNQRIAFYEEVMLLLLNLPCHLVLLAHETEKKEKSGSYNGNVRPLLNGQYGDKLAGNFTDWFRQKSAEKPNVDKMSSQDEAMLKDKWRMTKSEFKDMLTMFPDTTMYYWQTRGDDIFDGKCSSLVNYPTYVPADYKSFEKYRRKQTTTQ